MTRVIIDREVCKGCELCVSACKRGVLEMDIENLNKKGYYPVNATDEDKCTGCTNCAIICPDSAISIIKE